MNTQDVVAALAALAQETRLSIYRQLVQAGSDGLPAGSLAEQLGVPNATLSFHLKELTRAQLIVARSEGRFIYYATNYPAMNDLVQFLTENCCGGQACLPAITCSPKEKSR